MHKMLHVNANKFSESHQSDASSPSKLVSHNRLALSQVRNKNSSNSKQEGFNSGNDKKSTNPNMLHPTQKIFFSNNDLFPEFEVESTCELDGEMKKNVPHMFGAKAMDLKAIKSGRSVLH